MLAAVKILIAITVSTTMLGLGLRLQVEALRQWCRHPQLPLRLLLGSCLLVPVAGLLFLNASWSGSISRAGREAIALMALCPSAPMALRKARGLGDDQQLTALVQVSAALLAIVTIPGMGALFRWNLGVEGWDVLPQHVALQVGQIQVIPLLLGLGLRQWLPNRADRLAAAISTLANGLLLVTLVVVLAVAVPLLRQFLPGNWLALLTMLLLACTALLIGRTMAGPGSEHGRSGSIVTAMRNPGLALLFANQHSSELKMSTAAILIYVLITLALMQILIRPRRFGPSLAAKE
ncbi:MAG: transporter [Cyanobacteriota bacterium]